MTKIQETHLRIFLRNKIIICLDCSEYSGQICPNQDLHSRCLRNWIWDRASLKIYTVKNLKIFWKYTLRSDQIKIDQFLSDNILGVMVHKVYSKNDWNKSCCLHSNVREGTRCYDMLIIEDIPPRKQWKHATGFKFNWPFLKIYFPRNYYNINHPTSHNWKVKTIKVEQKHFGDCKSCNIHIVN